LKYTTSASDEDCEPDDGLAVFHGGWSPVCGSGPAASGIRGELGCGGGAFAAVELADDAGDVGAGLGVGRDAVVAVDGGGAGVVGGEGEGDVVAIAGEELVEIGRAAADVLLGREGVAHAEREAVEGMSCIRPRAPARETASALPLLSAWTTEASWRRRMWAWFRRQG
jgi:hypothetical protein